LSVEKVIATIKGCLLVDHSVVAKGKPVFIIFVMGVIGQKQPSSRTNFMVFSGAQPALSARVDFVAVAKTLEKKEVRISAIFCSV